MLAASEIRAHTDSLESSAIDIKIEKNCSSSERKLTVIVNVPMVVLRENVPPCGKQMSSFAPNLLFEYAQVSNPGQWINKIRSCHCATHTRTNIRRE